MMHSSETIAAIATAPGEAGIAVVRISGSESFRIADELFSGAKRPSEMDSGTFAYGYISDGRREDASGADVDEAIILVYRAPHSYTREDVAEIQCHGGRASAGRILKLVCERGARPAGPGEFTQRAFLNGRIDLLQAEAVADIVRASSDRAAAVAMEQLEGRLSCELNESYDDVMGVAADVEGTLDFPEDEVPEFVQGQALDRLRSVCGRLEELLRSWDEGHVLREGALVVIAGRPNVGKSTLMNRLLKAERVIVTELPGTTRDSIEEQLVLDGIPLRIVDTAGLREAESPVEREGIERAAALTARADLVLYMLDASEPLVPEDRARIERYRSQRVLLVLNKTDLGRELSPALFPEHVTVACSLRCDDALDAVEDAMIDLLGVSATDEPHAAISERHRYYIQNALKTLNAACQRLQGDINASGVLAASDLREALENLGMITGRVYTSELLESIFSRFCIGK